MSFKITVLPVMAVEDAVATRRYDAVLAVMPEHECCERFPWPKVGMVPRTVIGVSDLGADGPLSEDEATEILALCGADIVLPAREHVEDILAFGRTAERAGWRSILVHCHAAVSRSPAAAVILAAQQDGPGREQESAERIARLSPFGDFAPNLSLIHYADDLLDRKGALLAACREAFPDLALDDDEWARLRAEVRP